jgi:hypothetical protein
MSTVTFSKAPGEFERRQVLPAAPCNSLENAPPSTLAKARTERVERRTSESGDLQNPAPADCPDIHVSH